MTSVAVSFDGLGPRTRSFFGSSSLATSAALRASLLREAAATADPTDGYGNAAGQRARFDGVAALYGQGEWAEAFAQLSRLGDAGHAPSAKLALLMLRHGAALFDVQLRADPLHIARWASLVIDANKWNAAAAGAFQRVDRRVSLVDSPTVPTVRATLQRPISRPTASPSSMTAMA